MMEVAGGGPGDAYVSFFSAANPNGYADYLRTSSITHGFLGGPLQVSPEFGDTSLWPGDTFGISTLSPADLVLSWGTRHHIDRRHPQISPHRSTFSSTEPSNARAGAVTNTEPARSQRQPWTTLGPL